MKKKIAYTFKISMVRKIGAFALFALGITWFFFESLKVETNLAKILFNETLTFGEYQYTLTFYEHYFYPLLSFLIAFLFAFSRKKWVIKKDHLFFKRTFMGLSLYTDKKSALSSYQEVRVVVGSQMRKTETPMSNIYFFSVTLKNNHTFTNLEHFESYQSAQHFALWLKEMTSLSYADYT